MGTSPPDAREPFDAASFVERWRTAEPVLRQRARRFDVPEDDIDDLLSEVAARMFARHISPRSSRDFIAAADHMAYRIVLDRNRTERRRRKLDASRVIAPQSEYDPEAEDERERLELRIAVEQALKAEPFTGLTDYQRRAVLLLLRGGPFTGPERRTIHDAKKDARWLKWFEGLLGIAAAGWIRIRSRLPEPHHTTPALAAVAAIAAVSGLASTVASGTTANASSRAQHASGPPTLDRSQTPFPTTGERVGPVDPPRAVRTEAQATAVGAIGVVDASVTAHFPTGGSRGDLAIVVLRGTPLAATSNIGITIHCDTPTRRALCEAVAPHVAPHPAKDRE